MKSGKKIALSLGGNLGDVASAFDEAIRKLADGGLCEIRKSSIYKTTPVDCAPGTPDFLNMAITGVWGDSPPELLSLCKRVEEEAGRPAEHDRNASRSLDIDIILFGDEIISLPSLSIPHPEAKSRLFVLIPLVEIAPDWKYPATEFLLKDLLARLRNNRAG